MRIHFKKIHPRPRGDDVTHAKTISDKIHIACQHCLSNCQNVLTVYQTREHLKSMLEELLCDYSPIIVEAEKYAGEGWSVTVTLSATTVQVMEESINEHRWHEEDQNARDAEAPQAS